MTDLLNEEQLGAIIDRHYQGAGDRLFRMERLPHYAVEHQAAELAAWRSGAAFDLSWKQPWLDVLAGEVERGMRTRRVRVLSSQLTEDEQRSCQWDYPLTGRYEEIRVLHRGEHVVPDLLDHDYWIILPASAEVCVLAMHYSPTGAFTGAREVPAEDHHGYLDEMRRSWVLGEPFAEWWASHPHLHRTDRMAA